MFEKHPWKFQVLGSCRPAALSFTKKWTCSEDFCLLFRNTYFKKHFWLVASHCPSRLIIKPFGKTTVRNFIPCTFVSWLYTTISFKTGIQIQAIVPPTKSKQLYNGAPFPATASAYFCKYGGCKEYKFRNSSLWWWRW